LYKGITRETLSMGAIYDKGLEIDVFEGFNCG
jgi:hypothetical protein